MPAPSNVPASDDDICSAALLEFSERGYAGTSIARIARRARVHRSRVRRVFAHKDEAFREVVRRTVLHTIALELSGRALGAIEADESAVNAIRRFARDYWRSMERPALVAMLRLVVGELQRFPELAVLHATESFERFLHALERIIGEGVARGELRTSDVRASARTLLSALAAHTLWFAYPEIYAGVTGPDREKAAEATIEVLIRMLGPTPAEG